MILKIQVCKKKKEDHRNGLPDLFPVSLYLCLGSQALYLSFLRSLSLCNFLAPAHSLGETLARRSHRSLSDPNGKSSKCTPDSPQHVGVPDPTFGLPATSRGVLYKKRRRRESELVPANNPMGKLPEPEKHVARRTSRRFSPVSR